jgi:hypothetical protein
MTPREAELSTVHWIMANQILLDGRPLDLRTHPYQVEPLSDPSPRQCGMKGAQVGWTSTTMVKTIHSLIHGRYQQGALYLFPTREDTTDFSKGRFMPLINDNPCIASQVQDTDAANIKRIGRAMLYLRGARSTRTIQGTKKTSPQLKSVPVDCLVCDEYDEMEPAMIDMALERMAHSTVKDERYLSTPSIPDYGIDALYQKSDQRVWLIKCTHCGAWTCLEQEFPACLQTDKDGKTTRVCKKCSGQINHHYGVWIAQYPSRSKDLVGRWISQLNSSFVDPGKILEAYNNPPGGRLQEVFNSKLGRAYIEATHRLSVQEVLALCGTDGIAQKDDGPCFMGVDQGKDLHVVIGKKTASAGLTAKIIHLGVYKDWADLDQLMTGFHVLRCVVDALPEQRNARQFAERFKGKTYLNFYSDSQKGVYAWNEASLTVNSNRTESLDASHNQVLTASIGLPKECEITREFAVHLNNVAKRLEEDLETGSKKYVYVKLGIDHFRHAFNYEAIARSAVDKSLFPWSFA